jgi:hypothetical protein
MIKFLTEFNRNLTDWMDSLTGVGSIMLIFGLFALAILLFPLIMLVSVIFAGYVIFDSAKNCTK